MATFLKFHIFESFTFAATFVFFNGAESQTNFSGPLVIRSTEDISRNKPQIRNLGETNTYNIGLYHTHNKNVEYIVL